MTFNLSLIKVKITFYSTFIGRIRAEREGKKMPSLAPSLDTSRISNASKHSYPANH